MAEIPSSLEKAIQDVMTQVRGARIHQDTVQTVDAALRNLCERVERMDASPSVTSALERAEAAFHAGDTAVTIQHLSKALLEATRLPRLQPNVGDR